MIRYPFLGGTVGFDVVLHLTGIVEFAFEIKFKYFEKKFTAKVPVGLGRRYRAEHMV